MTRTTPTKTMNNLTESYHQWIVSLLGTRATLYSKLLRCLGSETFRYSIPRDENRYSDGISLRYKFEYDAGITDKPLPEDFVNAPCTMLEMMVALAMRLEDNIMYDSGIGDRTGVWFWQMIDNMGFGDMTDNRYNKDHVYYILNRFYTNTYDPDGSGGLFYLGDDYGDARDMEIWKQMCFYVSEIE